LEALVCGEGAHHDGAAFAAMQRRYDVEGEEFGLGGQALPAGQGQLFRFGHAYFAWQAFPVGQ